ncbi:hypothetical protein AOC36_02155 [Erysipelothrix larvae]|uniref:Phosphatidic acid phosphatase type 2/haloperoxidase domain-containing protein n=1 Tax=Erysipelothrix larvae TaxID=1514105 RepID=A0A0X8GYM0_9FIRM|nr:phosphatase PAP2 family protein [Erysipelothrix larvae]AMC92828.1 hypothetical protein AOC36_02155 [Erysipelothrix larvae]
MKAYKGNFQILSVILIALMFIGSLWDYQISQAIFNIENPIAVFLAAYGQMPASLMMSIGGTLLIVGSEKKLGIGTILQVLVGIVFNAFGLFMASHEPTMYYPNASFMMVVIINIVLFVCVNALILRLLNTGDKKQLRNYGWFLIFIVFFQILLINGIKVLWGRPRMRLIASNPDATFQNWWIIGSDLKDKLMPTGVISEEFKSFPSGHTASAACIFGLCILPYLNTSLTKYKNGFFWSCVGITLVIAFSRLVMGAHFLTDVTMGFTVFVVVFIVGHQLFYSDKKI